MKCKQTSANFLDRWNLAQKLVTFRLAEIHKKTFNLQHECRNYLDTQILTNWIVLTFTGSDALSNLASLGTIIAVIIAIKKYFSNAHRLEKEQQQRDRIERKQASENIDRELQDTLDALNRDRYKDEALYFKTKDGNEIFFMNRDLNHDFYDSLICSGKINFLRPELQQQVQNIFRQIKIHNEYLELTRKIKDTNDDKIIEKSYKYYIWMDENEQKLLKNIPSIQKKLKEDFI